MNYPLEFKTARLASSSPDALHHICNRPYYPKLFVSPSSPTFQSEISRVASLLHPSPSPSIPTFTRVTGGITNVLYKATFSDASFLLRIFGGEGLIDRDEETATYAGLCDAGMACGYLGRFGNGRMEIFLEGWRALKVEEMGLEEVSRGVCREMRRLHDGFSKEGGVVLWDQLRDWRRLVEGYLNDGRLQMDFQGMDLGRELKELEERVGKKKARVCFCHNDLLSGNIMVREVDGIKEFQLIDFEYGGINYAAFDIANHFNEYAGGTEDGQTRYELFPNKEQRRRFLTEYLDGKEGFQEMWDLMEDFLEINHLYWGLWACNQAVVEGCKEFDYLLYGKNRFNRYFEIKRSV